MTDELQKSPPGRRLHISAMRERAALLGGSVTIESKPGQGTSVWARIPLPPAQTP